MIEYEINCERASGKHSRSLRRLLLSLTEIDVRQGRFDKAAYSINELLGIYGTIIKPDVDDKIGHVRTLISKARISQLHEAEDN